MTKLITRKRLSMIFCSIGIGLIGVDLLMTRNFFTHIGELMAISIICLLIGLVLDRTPTKHDIKAGKKDTVARKAET